MFTFYIRDFEKAIEVVDKPNDSKGRPVVRPITGDLTSIGHSFSLFVELSMIFCTRD